MRISITTHRDCCEPEDLTPAPNGLKACCYCGTLWKKHYFNDAAGDIDYGYIKADESESDEVSPHFNDKTYTVEQIVAVVRSEPEYPDPCLKLRTVISEAIALRDHDHMLHIVRQAVRQTKESIEAKFLT
jgi:hypothetical protein